MFQICLLFGLVLPSLGFRSLYNVIVDELQKGCHNSGYISPDFFLYFCVKLICNKNLFSNKVCIVLNTSISLSTQPPFPLTAEM